MPTYQYACNSCSYEFEIVQTFAEKSLTECPGCKGELRKVFSAVGVVFKGAGFYKNDSSKKAVTKSTPEPVASVTPAPTPTPKAD